MEQSSFGQSLRKSSSTTSVMSAPASAFFSFAFLALFIQVFFFLKSKKLTHQKKAFLYLLCTVDRLMAYGVVVAFVYLLETPGSAEFENECIYIYD
jgi:hypothetical protein